MMTLDEYKDTLPRELVIYEPNLEIASGVVWLRNYLETSGANGFVLGLSGGLDSATVALWAAKAVGAEKLTLVAMPYGHTRVGRLASSTMASVKDAELLADLLPEADFRVLDITGTVDGEMKESGLADELTADPKNEALHLAAANLKARIRAVRLRTLANRTGNLVLGSENLSEHLLGYFTLGGDEESDVEMLSGFFKTQVRQLARALGVPAEILEKAPSADLWAGQTDEGELGFTYEQADLALYYAGDATSAREVARRIAEDRARRLLSPHVPEWFASATARVLARRDATAFKRRAKPTFIPVNRTRR